MSGIPGGGRKYGVQVGNETYSLILTQEDWEKRRLDREHARKLSLANNKRRKALDDKKRVAEARENRKRELELFKRRQRQIEATERYQRFHISAKDKRAQDTDFTENTPSLEEVLQKLRGGDGDGVVGIVPGDGNSLVTTAEYTRQIPSENHSPQPVNMERAQWQNMKEYAEDLKRQIFGMKFAEAETTSPQMARDDYLADDDGQDSLHGSSISGSSQPSYSPPTVTPVPVDPVQTQKEIIHKTNQILKETNYQEAVIPTAPIQNHEEPHSQERQNLSGTIRGSETGVLCKRDSQTGRITYYVKAYRPWSATVMNKPFQNAFHHSSNTNSLLVRPSSSYESSRRAPSNDYTSAVPRPPHGRYDTWASNNNSGYIVQHAKKLSDTTDEEVPVGIVPKSVKFSDARTRHESDSRPARPRQVSSAPVRTTTATPVSPQFFDNQREKNLLIREPKPVASMASSVTEVGSQLVTSHSVAKPPPTVTFSQNTVALVSVDAEKVLSELSESQKLTNGNVDERKDGALKGILRRYSKYDMSTNATRYGLAQPSYQSAGIARQKWLHGINIGPPTRELRTRSAESKSVRWHQVHYNDGSPSSTLNGHENIPPPPQTPAPKPQPPTRVQGVSSARGVKSPRKPSSARPKTAPSRGMRGGKIKNSGRRLRPAKEASVNIVPHPPPQKRSPKLSMSTVINYSIDPGDDTVPHKEFKPPNVKTVSFKTRPSSSTKRMSPIAHNKIVFHRKGKSENNGEAVTMSTLKSRGNEPRPYENRRDQENVVVNHGNQVTINVSSSKPITSSATARRVSVESGRIPLNGTPTDQEIEMLWDKVRSYLAWNKSRGNSPLVKKMRVPERKIAWGAPQPDSSAKHISANIISIDGGIFGKTTPEDTMTSAQNQTYKTSHQMPVHYERFGVAKSRKVAYSPSTQSQEYGYVSNHGQQFQMREKVRGAIPVVSNRHPSSAPVRRQTQLTDSVKTFRLVEALIEQNVPEDEILRALNSLQSATREV